MELDTLTRNVKVAFSGIQAKLPVNPQNPEAIRFERSIRTVDCAAVECYCGKTYAVTQKSLCEHPKERAAIQYQLVVTPEFTYLRSKVLD